MNFEVIKGKQKKAIKAVIYGPEGIGKSTFASQFPSPIYIDTEGSTNNLDVDRLQPPTSWELLMQELKWLKNNHGSYQTVVVDTADWAEKLCVKSICEKAGKSGIEDFGYGKGYTYVAEEFHRFLQALGDIVNAGLNVVLVAHATMRKFERPDEMGAYDRWELKLTRQTSPMIKEWADMVLFANYEIHTIKTESGKAKAQGGKRVMYTVHNPCFDAKNRFNLPEKLDFDFTGIAGIFAGPEAVQKPEANPEPEEATEEQKQPQDPVPQELRDLMNANNVTDEELKEVCAQKGYYPAGTPLENFSVEFFSKLIRLWDQVFPLIESNRNNTPFEI